ncbi:PAS domain-containing sensor histidine kinase [Paraburkholderia hospita]|uniref:PAS domain-containing sensor histidine kinase n=1 Tax=Paraburkholderia hospita TaxID=169430 RepID=UPI000271B6B6|nr:ATP-binding protein [Paraburkholderia hospita]EUC12397.1 PAS/PAC sensor signal transduction histidine kinase [Burkholderia sp. BT03]SKC52682.1 PAS domain S-box-containing protein [Paraburkholderia hospita]
MQDTEGEIVNWYGLAADIHKRQLAQEALRKEERHLRRLVDAMPAMIWRATPAGDIDHWNLRMLAFIGKSWEEIDGQRFLSLIPENDRDRVHSRWIQAVHKGASYEDTYQITGADGKLSWCLVRGEPFRDENGEILHWYCVSTDISDLKHTEAALQQREHQLRREVAERVESERKLRNYQDELMRTENLAVIGKLSAGLAHEISQPIAAMVTLSETALRFLRRGDCSTAEFNLSRIGELATRMSTLTGRLRSFARRPDGEIAAVPLAASIGSAVTLLSHRLKNEQVELRVVAPSQPLLALCEAVRLEQVLVNLVSNAIEAMETSKTRAVEIRLYREGDRMVIEILDTGIGLSDTVQAKLFEPFFTTKKVSGLGLGLAICFDIVASFGGSLTARNRLEGGALFRLMLIAAPEEDTCK